MLAVFYSGLAICCFAALQNFLWAFTAPRPRVHRVFAVLCLSAAFALYLNLNWLNSSEPLGLLSMAVLMNTGLLVLFIAAYVDQPLTRSLQGAWLLLLVVASSAHGLSQFASPALDIHAAEQNADWLSLLTAVSGGLGFMVVFTCIALGLVAAQAFGLMRQPRSVDAYILLGFLLAQGAVVLGMIGTAPTPTVMGLLPVLPILGLVALYALRLGFERLNVAGQMEQERAVTITERLERRKLEVSLQNIAYADPLTSLPNRVAFLQEAEQLLQKEPRRNLVIYLLGINHFKDVNNAYGQSVGDELLRLVADRLRSHFYDKATIARVAGDVFALLAEDVQDIEEGDNPQQNSLLADMLLSILRVPYQVFDFTVKLDFGLGVVQSTEVKQEADAHSLLIDAEYAMQRAKMGIGGAVFFDVSIKEAKAREHRLLTLMRGAESRGELELRYQVKVNDQAEVIGMEALIRWFNPEFGLVSNEEFIPLAERYGLINPIGEWVALKVCQQMAQWLEQGLRPGRMSFNVSPFQLKSPGFSSLVRALVNKYEVPAEYLEVEVTESTLIGDFEVSKRELNALREMGFHVSIDDFGTGYSSMSYMGQLPLDTLKIDKSFVANILEEGGAEMVRSIIHVGKAFGCDIIAEGVETQAQLDALKALGCTQYQGYFFSHPLTARDVRKILSAADGIFKDRMPEQITYEVPEERSGEG